VERKRECEPVQPWGKTLDWNAMSEQGFALFALCEIVGQKLSKRGVELSCLRMSALCLTILFQRFSEFEQAVR
jgi:hypothetical protein